MTSHSLQLFRKGNPMNGNFSSIPIGTQSNSINPPILLIHTQDLEYNLKETDTNIINAATSNPTTTFILPDTITWQLGTSITITNHINTNGLYLRLADYATTQQTFYLLDGTGFTSVDNDVQIFDAGQYGFFTMIYVGNNIWYTTVYYHY